MVIRLLVEELGFFFPILLEFPLGARILIIRKVPFPFKASFKGPLIQLKSLKGFWDLGTTRITQGLRGFPLIPWKHFLTLFIIRGAKKVPGLLFS